MDVQETCVGVFVDVEEMQVCDSVCKRECVCMDVQEIVWCVGVHVWMEKRTCECVTMCIRECVWVMRA